MFVNYDNEYRSLGGIPRHQVAVSVKQYTLCTRPSEKGNMELPSDLGHGESSCDGTLVTLLLSQAYSKPAFGIHY